MKRNKGENKRLTLDKKRIDQFKSKMDILKHLTKKDCKLLPYLNDESLHVIGELIFNVITQRMKLNKPQEKRVKRILNKNKQFYLNLIDKRNKQPLSYLRANLKGEPQVGQGVLSMLAALAPLVSSLFIR